MTEDRQARIIGHLYPGGRTELEAARLGQVCAAITGATGAGLMLMTEEVHRGAVATTDDISTLIEDLQFELGEGPCIDAYRLDRPVYEPDLANPTVVRWVAFSPPAVDAGARAVFGFPLRVGTIHLGAMNLYNDRTGTLSDDQHADALVMADVAAEALLIMQAHAPPGELGRELERGSDRHSVVHQASGMLAVQLDVNVAQALIRLRGYAFSHNRPLRDVAADVVGRQLSFKQPPGEGTGA